MQTVTMFFLVAVAVMSFSGALAEEVEEHHGLFKRYINCPPGAICLPATQPTPVLRLERSANLGQDEGTFGSVLLFNDDQELNNHRQKRGSKPVPITYCIRKTGKCGRL